MSLLIMLCAVVPVIGMDDQDVVAKALQGQVDGLKIENKQLKTRIAQLMLDFGKTLKKLNRTEKEWKEEKELEWREEYNKHVAMYKLAKQAWRTKKEELEAFYKNQTLERLKIQEVRKTGEMFQILSQLKAAQYATQKEEEKLKEVETLYDQVIEQLETANKTTQYYMQQRHWWKRAFMIGAASFLAYFLYVQCVYSSR